MSRWLSTCTLSNGSGWGLLNLLRSIKSVQHYTKGCNLRDTKKIINKKLAHHYTLVWFVKDLLRGSADKMVDKMLHWFEPEFTVVGDIRLQSFSLIQSPVFVISILLFCIPFCQKTEPMESHFEKIFLAWKNTRFFTRIYMEEFLLPFVLLVLQL